jgi:Flp pilus assembly protein TadG
MRCLKTRWPKMRWLKDLRLDRRGGAAVEFAILAPVLFTILFGIVEMGRMFYVRQALEYATEQAARYYMLNPTTDSGSVTTYLQGQMAGGMGSGITVDYTDTTSCNGNSTVTCTMITASYTFTFVAAILGLSNLAMHAKAQAIRY